MLCFYFPANKMLKPVYIRIRGSPVLLVHRSCIDDIPAHMRPLVGLNTNKVFLLLNSLNLLSQSQDCFWRCVDWCQSQLVKMLCSQILILVSTSAVNNFSCIMNVPARPSLGNCIFKTVIERVPEAPRTIIFVLAPFFQQQNTEPALTTTNQLIHQSQSSTTSP